MPLGLAACVVSAPETDLDGYVACVAQLRQLTLETFAGNDLSRADRIYAAQSALAFEGDRIWGRAFERLNDGEFSGTCPSCQVDLYFAVGQFGFFCGAGDWVRNAEAPRTDIHARLPSELPAPREKLYALCAGSDDVQLGEWICRLFGISTCPNCDHSVDVPMVIAAFESPGSARSGRYVEINRPNCLILDRLR